MRVARILIPVLLVLSFLCVTPPVRADDALGVNLTVANFLINSTAKADAALFYGPNPVPPVSQMQEILFNWTNPLGALVHTESVQPNVVAAARSTYYVDLLGSWSVNVIYLGNASITNNKSFNVVVDYWGPGDYFVSNSTVVSNDATLTIETGTIVRFDQGKTLVVEGKLVAQGTEIDPIVFTSNLSSPSPGDWNHIVFDMSSDELSVIDHVTVEYSTDGIFLDGASPAITNSTFIDNQFFHIIASQSSSVIRGNTLRRVAGGATGIVIQESNITLEENNVESMKTGIQVLNSNISMRDNLVTGSETVGMHIVSSNVNSSNDSVLGVLNGVKNGVMIDSGSDAVFEGLSITGFTYGLSVSDKSRALLWNSSVDQVELSTFDLDQSSIVTIVNTSFSTITGGPGIIIPAADDSVLTIQNFLVVEVISHDNGTHLANATIEVYDGSNLTHNVQTDGNGLTQLLVVTDMTYKPTLINNITKIHVSWDELAFQENNRSVDMGQSHTEIFNGSIDDLDGDGEPDFSDDDIDGDDLSNSIESSIGTDPMNPDSDTDGIPDGYEFGYPQLLNPLLSDDASLDPDDDGLTNLEEFLNGTYPDFSDSDNDGVNDFKELGCGMDPLNQDDAGDDWDADGFDNGEECKAGSDLLDPDDTPEPGLDILPILLGVAIIAVVLVVVLIMIKKRKPAPAEEDEPSEDVEEEPAAQEEPEDSE